MRILFMDNSSNQNQPDENNNYQDILNQAAASVKPEAPAEPIPEPVKENTEPQAFLKEVNSPQLESPIHPSLSANLEDEEPEISENVQSNINPEPVTPIIPPVTPEIPTPTPTPTPETRTPEEIKEEVNKILADDTSSSSSTLPPTKSGPNPFKISFVLALLLFLGIGGTLVYALFFAPASKNTTNNTPSNTPTAKPTINSGPYCDLNDKRYFQGESFPSADGCNTCSCESQDMIACTEKACAATKSGTVVTPTKSATTSSIPKDWKKYEDKEIGFSFNYPANITLTKKLSNGVFSLAINTQVNLAGGINVVTGITVDRGGSSLDFGGYIKNGDQITYTNNKNNSTICNSKTIQKIYKNQNNIEIVLLKGLNNPGEENMLGPCETDLGNIKALINTKNKTYPGIAFITNSIIKEVDLLKILDTFKFN